MDRSDSSPEQPALPSSSVSLPATNPKNVFETFKRAARLVLKRRFRVALLVRDAYERMISHSDVLSAVWHDLQTALRLLVAWVDRSYRSVSWTPLVLIVGALLYFASPADAIPDVLGAIGFVDDVAVISTVLENVRDELDQFRAWEQNR